MKDGRIINEEVKNMEPTDRAFLNSLTRHHQAIMTLGRESEALATKFEGLGGSQHDMNLLADATNNLYNAAKCTATVLKTIS